MKVVSVAREALLQSVETILQELTFIITEISKNPSNPKFNHYAFETLAWLVKFVCASDPSLVTAFENFLFTPFQNILAQEVAG